MINELKFQNISDTVAAAIIITDELTGRILNVNKAASDIYGYDHEEFIRLKSADLSAESYKTAHATEQISKHKFLKWHRHKNGNIFPVEITADPMTLSGVRYVIFIVRDIAERARVEEAACMSRKQMDLAVEGSGLGLWDWNILTGKINLNEQWAQIIGRKLNELGPVNVDTWVKDIHPDDLKKAEKLLQKHFAGELPVYESELRMRHKDGRWIWVLDRGKVVERDEYGKPARMIGTHADITGEKQEREELLRNARKYMQLLEFSNDGYLAINCFDETTYVNSRLCEIFGYSKGELIGSKLVEFIGETHFDSFISKIKKCRKGEKISYNYEMAHKDGQKVFVNITASPRFDVSEKYCGAFALINDFTRQKELEKEIKTARMELLKSYSFSDIIGKSEPMQNIFESLPTIAEADCNVLIEGASGTGKNMIAQVIQNISGRKKNPFITVNCGTLPENLLESELFGFVKGAFTGADKDKPGKFAIADGGVIFLDEIGELPLNLQVKLLRAIDEKRFEPIGSNKTINANIRIIAATNKDLNTLVKAGKFRSDLYYRLNVVNVKLPLLKDRTEDIYLLTEHFIGHFNAKYHKNIKCVSDEVYRFFRSYSFPGNIRELKNIIERAFVFCNDETIKLQYLSPEYRTLFKGILNDNFKKSATLCNTEHMSSANVISDIKNVEKEIIIETIKKCHGNKTMAARALKMDKSTLWRKMKKMGLDHMMSQFDACGKDHRTGHEEPDMEKEKLMDALEKTHNNKSEAAKLLGINRITFWRKLKKFKLI